jgi:hypothetical protein
MLAKNTSSLTRPTPFSPVHSARKFSAVLGVTSENSCEEGGSVEHGAREYDGTGAPGLDDTRIVAHQAGGGRGAWRRASRTASERRRSTTDRESSLRRTVISMRPAGAPPMATSKKTVGFGILARRRAAV